MSVITFDADAKLGVIGNGGLQEGDRTLLALIGHDLNEGDPRGIVDADMDELPTDTVVTIDRARISPGDAMPHRTDPAELFDIEMDELTRMLAFITPDRFTGAADAAGRSDLANPPNLRGDIYQPTSERSAICRTIRSRPRGVSRAFLCTFIRFSLKI